MNIGTWRAHPGTRRITNQVLPVHSGALGFHSASFAACASCFSLRAMFRVCHDLLSVFGFAFSFLCDSRFCGVVVFAISSPLTLSDDGTVTVLLGDGHGGFTEASGSPVAAGPAPWEVAIGDIDDDGNLDLIVVPYERDVKDPARVGVIVLLGDGNGRFAPMPGSPLALSGCHGPNAIAAGDLRGTRRRDIAIACATSATVVVFRAQPGGAFTQTVIPNGTDPTWGGIAAADLDGDGRDDIVVSNSPEGVVRIIFGARDQASSGLER